MYEDFLVLSGLISLVVLSYYLGRQSHDIEHLVDVVMMFLAKDNIIECYEDEDNDMVVFSGTKRPTKDEMKKLQPMRFHFEYED